VHQAGDLAPELGQLCALAELLGVAHGRRDADAGEDEEGNRWDQQDCDELAPHPPVT
jgi:hypothetical protein